jgi:hypothetical protein
MEALPEGHPDIASIIDDIVAEKNKVVTQPDNGTVTWDDVNRTRSMEGWTPGERQQLKLTAQVLGATPVEAIHFAAAWEDHRGRMVLEPDAPTPDYRTLWGADYDRKFQALSEATGRIPDAIYDRMVGSGLLKSPALVEMLVTLGRRRND